MADLFARLPRVAVDGKFFRRGSEKLHLKGVSYGPFAPGRDGQPFATAERTTADLQLVKDLGANLLRLYHVPPRWFLDLAAHHQLLLLIDIPWNKHLVFLDDPVRRAEARQAVCHAVLACARHPAVLGYSVANEIPPDVVRWSGTQAVAEFLDELIGEAKRIDPECLCTYANYPTTEFLQPQTLDFVSFNVYLHQPAAFKNYLARLQMLSGGRPLVLSEYGCDSRREGALGQAEMLSWQTELAFRGGVAGAVVFSFTDDWHRGGESVADWQMGLTTAAREKKPAFDRVKAAFQAAPKFPLGDKPRVSVIVASYNGAATLKACLDSLRNLNYGDYEIILVDDGSTDDTPRLAQQYPTVRYFRHPANLGLSVARNTGIAAATGAIVAFTDADCRVDEDWLYYLVADLVEGEFAAVGGPNLLPPEDSAVAAAVMVSPGGPAHVMISDREAEHIPGCNMAFRKSALVAIGGFDPIFHTAGDDVDVCWRLQQAGCKIGFNAAGFVWHYRRATVRAYWRQQSGYGRAEALLVRKHPEYFNAFGNSRWRGRIYGSANFGLVLQRPIIYRGIFSSAPFQTVYAAEPATVFMMLTTVEYYALVVLPLWALAIAFPVLWPMAVVSLSIPLTICGAAGMQATLPRGKCRWWSRALVALLFLLQPVARGWARHQSRLALRLSPAPSFETLESIALRNGEAPLDEVCYWAERRMDRLNFVGQVLRGLDQRHWPYRADVGWSEFDAEVFGNRWSCIQFATVAEEYSRGRQLIRCRLRARWSLQAQAALWLLLAAEVVLLGAFVGWFAMLLGAGVVLGGAFYLVRGQKRRLQSELAGFLNGLAEELGLVKISRPDLEPAAAADASVPATVPKSKPAPRRVELPAAAVVVPAAPPAPPAGPGGPDALPPPER
ncbi:MAG TPA: glycosyltransferase [Verrucomicrobiota bacterium]|nr:glycosyltransferase [Verrucomicrobiota bacterium]HNT14768.1 glycosyltransferase [Verrucomicrobiota bacterium]